MTAIHAAPRAFPRTPLPPQLCNLERALFAMQARGIDGLVASTGLNTFYLSGLNPEQVILFFHGLGLSHMDLEQTTADGQPNRDWVLEEDMVVPLHLLYPGGERERMWVEEVVRVTPGGGEPLFTWGFDPICR